jgi:uncharacterized RDD family membrane protein YckC
MATDSGRSQSPSPAIPLRRIGAFCIDYMACGSYAGVLFGIVLLANNGRVPQREFQPVEGQSIGLLSLTIPVILYFAICESSRWQGTIGKRLLGLRVQDMASNRLSFRKTLLRAFLKFLPWELGHTFVHQLVSGTTRSEASQVPLWAWSLLAVSILLDAWYLISLWVGSGRTAYDRATGAQVVITHSHRAQHAKSPL